MKPPPLKLEQMLDLRDPRGLGGPALVRVRAHHVAKALLERVGAHAILAFAVDAEFPEVMRTAIRRALAEIGDVQHQDIGQMNMYLGYFAREENQPEDNPPIGIILSRHKDELLVEYATYQMNSTLFVQKYQLYLPDREALRHELELSLREAGE